MKGKVISVDRRGKTVTVAHEEIPGYMEAMTMPFTLRDEWAFDVLAPGKGLQATLVVDGDRSWIENVIVTEESTDPAAPTAAANIPRPGDAVPDFTLVNQDGERIRLSRYRGRALALTFIYTRCPLPDFCPLMTERFTEIDRALRKDPARYEKTRLLSVSVDPEYDTPKVLRDYGARHTGNSGPETFEHWEFASGTKDEVKKIAEYFGLRYWPDGGQIIHSLSTAVISPQGRLVKLYTGNQWKAAEVVADLDGGDAN